MIRFSIKAPVILILSFFILHTSCESDENVEPVKNIAYFTDGRTVKHGDPLPIILDIDADEQADFTIFAELAAHSGGDHLYFGINPIGVNLIKAGPYDDSRLLNMGFLIAEELNSVINEKLDINQRWTGDHNILVVRHTYNDMTTWYEGSWAGENPEVVGIKLFKNDQAHYGWLRLQFDRTTEIMTLIDYAYGTQPVAPLKAGEY